MTEPLTPEQINKKTAELLGWEETPNAADSPNVLYWSYGLGTPDAMLIRQKDWNPAESYRQAMRLVDYGRSLRPSIRISLTPMSQSWMLSTKLAIVNERPELRHADFENLPTAICMEFIEAMEELHG